MAEEKFPNSSVNKLLQAEIEYGNGNLENSLNYANECLNTESNGDNAFAAFLLKGDIYTDKINTATPYQAMRVQGVLMRI